MKRICILFCWTCFAFYCNAQAVDLKGVSNESDSLMQLVLRLLDEGKYETALNIAEPAQKKYQLIFGDESYTNAEWLHYKAYCYSMAGKSKESEPLYLQALDIHKKVSGSSGYLYNTIICNLSICYKNLAQFDKAEPYYNECLSLTEVAEGKKSRKYAKQLSNIAVFYKNLNQLSKAETYFLEAKEIVYELEGKESQGACSILNNLGVLYKTMGRYKEAEIAYEEALYLTKKVYGITHPYYAGTLNNFAKLYLLEGDFDKAEPMFIESLKIREDELGKEHPKYLRSLSDASFFYSESGQYEKAIISNEYIVKTSKKVLGEEHPNVATYINNLGILYQKTGKYEKAEEAFLESKKTREIVFGKVSKQYAGSIGCLGSLYMDIGNFTKAEEYLKESIKIREQTLGKEHIDYIQSSQNLSKIYLTKQNIKKSEEILIELKNIHGKILGTESVIYSNILRDLSYVYLYQNEFEKAKILTLESLEKIEKSSGKNSVDYAVSLVSLSEIYKKTKRYSEAEISLLQACKIYEDAAILENRSYKSSLQSLGVLYQKMNELDKSEKIFIRSSIIGRQTIERNTAFLNQIDLKHSNTVFTREMERLVSFAPKRHVNSTLFKQTIYDNYLLVKGLLLESTQSINRSIAAAPDSIRLIHASWQGYHRRLATEYAKPLAERKFVAEMEARADSLEKILVRSVAGFADTRQRIEWSDVQKNLQSGEAAVEFVRFQYYNPEPTDSVLYGALVLRPGDEAPQFITLFEKNDVTGLMQGVMGSNFTKINAAYRPNAVKSLYDFIWKPIEPYLKGVKTVYCSPSGLLHRLNMGSLAINDRETVADRRRLILLGSTRQLATRSRSNVTYNTTAYLAGGIRYSMDSTAIVTANRNRTRGLPDNDELKFDADSTTRSNSWNYLPESASEVAEIGKLLHKSGLDTKVDTSYLASEEAFRSLGVSAASPRIIHLSTHGFFFPDPQKISKNPFPDIAEEPVFKTSEHPMVRSGLLMAGANQAWQTGKKISGLEDGILTAYEISQMDLSGTELVILSACETGLGDIEGNEGVYGLQRAFKIAGAKYLIMSLWKVNDQSTRELMTEFYRQWLENGQTIPDAFTAAQKTLRKKYPDAPYHWAGFVLVE